MKEDTEIKEWVEILKKQISEIYLMYRPADNTFLHSVDSEALMQKMSDLILKAGSKQEAVFYLLTVEKMIHQLAMNHVDVLSIHKTGESLRIITQSYEELLRTYKGKIDSATQNFQELLTILTGDIQPSVPEGKLNFADSIAVLATNFTKKAEELQTDLKRTSEKSNGPAQKKIGWLVKSATEITKIAQEFQKSTAPAERMQLLSQLRKKNDEFIKISHTNSFDLIEHSPTELPAPISLEKFSDTIRMVHLEIRKAFPSILFNEDDAEKLIGLGLGMSGIVTGQVDSLATSMPGKLTTGVGKGFSGITGVQSRFKDFKAKKFLKLGAFFTGGLALSLVVVLLPTLLPTLLTGLTVAGDLDIMKDLFEQLIGSFGDQERTQSAIYLAGVFFNSAKADLENRKQEVAGRHQLKQDILESENPKEHLPKLKSVYRQQCLFFAKTLMAGKETAVASELRNVIGGELLVQGSNKPLTYSILTRLQEKIPEPGAVAKILNLNPRDCSKKLNALLEEDFKPAKLEKFVDHLYSCRSQATQQQEMSQTPSVGGT